MDDIVTVDEGKAVLESFREWVAANCVNFDLLPLEIWSLIGAYCEGSMLEELGIFESSEAE